MRPSTSICSTASPPRRDPRQRHGPPPPATPTPPGQIPQDPASHAPHMPLPRLDRLVSVHLVAPWHRHPSPSQGPTTAILMYHSVSDDPETGIHPYYRLATPPALFRQHLDILADQGFDVVSLHQAARNLAHTQSPTRPMAVITFDDGFRDFLTHAWPALHQRRLPATVFLPTSFIADPRRTFVGRECLTWTEVRDLHAAGVSFGSHSVSHPKLEALQPDQLRAELADSRAALEDHLQSRVDTFCHPYGFPAANLAYVQRFRAALQETGYSIATTTNVGRASPASDLLLLPRLPVNGADDPQLFTAKIRGAYDWTARPQAILKRVKRALRSFA